jgi:ABC-type branched-subunit amino acid transport system ATPase component
MLQATNISKHFDGIQALSSVSIECKQGSITGIIGPNGSGKSTLVNVLTNMLSKNGGKIIMKGNYSRTFQDARLWGNLTVLDTILLSLETRSVLQSIFTLSPHQKEALAVIQRIGLDHHTHTQARHLSYGQRKLLELGRALAGDTKILFLDEPFAGLFPEVIYTIKTILSEEKEKGTAIILIEHDMAIIKELCDYVYVLDSGKNIAEGRAVDVLNDQAVKTAYLGD